MHPFVKPYCVLLVCLLGLCNSVSEAAPFAYIPNAVDGSVSVIDTATNNVVATIPGVGSEPEGVAVSPTGAFVYVTGLGPIVVGAVCVIDTATNNVVCGVGPKGGAYGVAITPDSKTAYVVHIGANLVTPIDTATKTSGTPIPVGSLPLVSRLPRMVRQPM